jgi:Na+/melibiose symporter-like transporter
MTDQRLPSWRIAAFSAPCLPLAAMLLPVTIYLPNYYARDLGVDLAVVGWAFGLVRIFDLWFDPALGFAMDRTRTRFGRFRPWVVAGAPIAMVAVFMLFMAEPGITGAYILLWLILGFVGQSMAQLGHMAWAAQAVPSYDQRSRVYGWWQAFTVGGMLIILSLPVLVEKLGGSDTAGVQAMGWFVIAVLPPAILLALMAVREPVERQARHPLRLKPFIDMFRQPGVLRLLFVDILLGTGPALAGTLFFFYFDAVRGFPRGEAAQLLLVYFVGGLLGAPLWSILARKIGKHRALMAAAVFYAFAQMSVLVSPEGLGWAVAIMFLAGIPFSAGSILLKAMMADTGDAVRLHTGADQTGLLFSLLTGSIKIGSALAVIIGMNALAQAGFDPKAGSANSPEALSLLAGIFTFVPAGLALLGVWIISGYRLDADTHADIRQKLDARDQLATFGGQAAPPFGFNEPAEGLQPAPSLVARPREDTP